MITDKYGNKRWFNSDNKLHREDGPAIEYNDGSKYWFINGVQHRENGPAVENGETFVWFINGKLHREDGPAMQFSSNEKIWYYNDKRIECSSQKEFEKLIKLKAFW